MLGLLGILMLVVGLLQIKAGNTDIVLKINMLNQQQQITVPLQEYFNQPKLVQIDRIHSTPKIDSILNIVMAREAVINISSLQMSAPMGNTTYLFNSSAIILSRSIYNQPNKVFLMENNVIFSVRYQFTKSQNKSFTEAIKIAKAPLNCTKIQVMEHSNSNYLIASCLHSGTNVTLFPYRFNETSSGFISNLIPLKAIELKLVIWPNECSRVLLYPFKQLYIDKLYKNKILLTCPATTIASTLKLYILSFDKQNTTNELQASLINYSRKIDTLLSCTQGSTYMVEYQRGFLTLTPPNLKQYIYNQTGDGNCNPTFINASNYSFMAALQDRQTQYIYIIKSDRIMIKESYSPNFQILNITAGFTYNLTLDSYSITHKFLALLYQNRTHYKVLVYDLAAVYPHFIDEITYNRSNNNISLFSVFNFLQSGNYFFLFDQTNNLLNLNYYKGYEVTVSVKNPELALGNIELLLIFQSQTLLLNFTFRDFRDSTIAKVDKQQIFAFRQILNINLSDFVIGPLGHFYNYPNSLSAFQYINYYSQLNVFHQLALDESLLALSINNQLNEPILTFYYAHSFRSCGLSFSLSQRKIQFDVCQTARRKKTGIDIPIGILVLGQGKFIQYDRNAAECCSLSSNDEYECIELNVQILTAIQKIILISYSHKVGQIQNIELLIHNSKVILYCQYERNAMEKHYKLAIYYHITNKHLPQLNNYNITLIYTDIGYKHFLVLHLRNASLNQVIIYDKPEVRKNSSSTLIGHLIQSFSIINLQGVFCVSNLLILMYSQGLVYQIKEYKITKSYRIRYNRQYPLYSHKIKTGGRHYCNQNYVYLETIDDMGQAQFFVYSPLASSFNVLSHKFQSKSDKPILFAQQIGQTNNNSMGLNGGFLFGLTLPNLIFKFIKAKQIPTDPSLTIYNFNVSVVDDNNVMNILGYQFTYKQQKQTIYYDIGEIAIELNSQVLARTLLIDGQRLSGPVNEYDLSAVDQCDFVTIDRKDIFTKKQCLLYNNPKQLGIMSDFISVVVKGEELQIVVTDLKLFCVRRKIIPSKFTPYFNNLTDCQFQVYSDNILMYCTNANTFSKQIYNVTINLGIFGCSVDYTIIVIPDWFKYQDFQMIFNSHYIILEVPIRYQRNKIYYKALFTSNNQISSSNYSLLKRDESQQSYQSEFQSIDTSLSGELFFLLQDGIGIYNLSDSFESIGPAIWIPASRLPKEINQNDEFVYLKFMDMLVDKDLFEIKLQIGTATSSYDILIIVTFDDKSSASQTRYNLYDIVQLYEYQQYQNCYNTPHSQSQRYDHLIIKICNYVPQEYYVFANFISITNQSTNSLIQFYNKSGSSSYPFRIDLIYSNFYSNDNFQIQNDTLIVGSLFNLLCYYQLAPTVSWTITKNSKRNQQTDKDSQLEDKDMNCTAKLTLSNNQHTLVKYVKISYDDNLEDQMYWSNWVNYVQRIVLFLLLANTIRLLIVHRKKRQGRLKKKGSNRLPTSKFQVMVKINSKKSI